MPAAKPATIASELDNEIKGWLFKAPSYMDPSSFQFKLWARAVDKLFDVDAFNGSILRAILLHCTGNVEDARYWANNLRKLNGVDEARKVEAVIFSNLGYFSQAAASLAPLDAQSRAKAATMLFISGAFNELRDTSREVTDVEDPGFHQAARAAARCAMTLESLHISQEHVQKVLDLAGSVLRQHRLFFQGETPVVHTHDDGLLYQLLVDAEPQAAAAMTNEVILLMVENDLDLPGLAFAFVGTKH